MEINLTVIIKSKSKYREELTLVLRNLVGNSTNEAACLRYDLHQDIEDPNIFIFHEVWKDKEGLELHKEQSYSLEFRRICELFLEEKIMVYATSRME
jgi:quinol monooxygenase YgiN